MLLNDVLEKLIRVELGNLAIGKPEWSDNTFNYKMLISAVSDSYLELHKRFLLKKEIVRIVPLLSRTVYPLELQYAVSDATVTDKFIVDSVDNPFSDNIAMIDGVYDKNMCRVSYNTTTFMDVVSIKDSTTLLIPDPALAPELRIVCRGLPNPIELDDESDLESYVINLPYQYQEALLCYAAAKIYSNRGAENATNNESAILFARFEQACFSLDQLGLTNREERVNDKLAARGFV